MTDGAAAVLLGLLLSFPETFVPQNSSKINISTSVLRIYYYLPTYLPIYPRVEKSKFLKKGWGS